MLEAHVSSDLTSLMRYAAQALRRTWEDHNSLGDKGRELGLPGLRGRQETQLGTLAWLHVQSAVAEWCKAPGLGVRVYFPGGSMDCGDTSNVSCSLWFSGIWGSQVYEAFALEDRLAGNTPGYGIAYAVAEGIDPTFWQLRGAGIVRLDTGEMICSGDGSGTWLSNCASISDQGLTRIYSHCIEPTQHTVVLADAQFSRRTAALNTFDTGSSFGNVFHMLTGRPVSIKGIDTSVTAAIAACGYALPAVYHLLRECGGCMFFPEFDLVGSQKISSVANAPFHPTALGFSLDYAWQIVSNLK